MVARMRTPLLSYLLHAYFIQYSLPCRSSYPCRERSAAAETDHHAIGFRNGIGT